MEAFKSVMKDIKVNSISNSNMTNTANTGLGKVGLQLFY